MNIALNQIGQISVTVHDLPRAVAFYRDRLGLKHLFAAGTMAFFECGGIRLMLALPEKPEFDHPSSILYFKVEDIDGTARAMSEQGVEFAALPRMVAKMPDHELWMAFFRDPEGNVHALMSEKRP